MHEHILEIQKTSLFKSKSHAAFLDLTSSGNVDGIIGMYL